MARIRTVKPEFFRHAELYEAEREAGIPLRVAFAGLWTAADREGRFKWAPRELKLDCLPYDEVDFSRVLDALWTRGFIVKYAVDGREYGCIPSWKEHQHINNRELKSSLPEPNKNNVLPTRDGRVDDACVSRQGNCQGEGKGKEEEGKERKEDTPDGVPPKYVFEDGIIRLNKRDFEKWRKAYGNLSLEAELTSLSEWAGRPENREKWFHAVSGALAKRNREVGIRIAQNARGSPAVLTPSGNPWPEGIT